MLTVAAVITKAAWFETERISSSACRMRLTRVTLSHIRVRLYIVRWYIQGSAVVPVTCSDGGIAVLLYGMVLLSQIISQGKYERVCRSFYMLLIMTECSTKGEGFYK